jgi:hypothetical protein
LQKTIDVSMIWPPLTSERASGQCAGSVSFGAIGQSAGSL